MQRLFTYTYPLGKEPEMCYDHSNNIEALNRDGWRVVSVSQSVATFSEGTKQGLLVTVLVEKKD